MSCSGCMSGAPFAGGEDSSSSSISVERLTLKIIPKDTLVKMREVPPILINGSVKPVTGKSASATAILISD